jgi:pyruvate ferredoxin oxidoreductase delta subunit
MMESKVKIVRINEKLPISFPQEGAAGKTGSWRLYRPIVDNNKCTKCFLCELYCPGNVIETRKDGIQIELDYCKGCGICAKVCPQKAIEMVPETVEVKIA